MYKFFTETYANGGPAGSDGSCAGAAGDGGGAAGGGPAGGRGPPGFGPPGRGPPGRSPFGGPAERSGRGNKAFRDKL